MPIYTNKEFIEAVDNRYESEFSNRVFRVVFEDILKPDKGFWLGTPSLFGCTHRTTIKLDDEDIEYLYNKYKDKALMEIVAERNYKDRQKQEEIKKLEDKILKLKESE